jgi:hypothetical protein
MTRTETKTLIARQTAIHQGLVWERVLRQPKLLASYLTLAENILATIERKAQTLTWKTGTFNDADDCLCRNQFERSHCAYFKTKMCVR